MNTRNLLFSGLLLVSVLLSACVPVVIATQPAPTAMLAVPTANSAPKNTAEIAATIPIDTYGFVVVGAGAVWVAHLDKGLVTRIDPVTNSVVAQIQVDNPTFDFHHPVPGDMAFVGNQLWVTTTSSIGTGEVARIDTITNEVVERIPMSDLQYPNGTLSFSPWGIASDGDTLWVSDFLHTGIAHVDTKTGQVIAQILNVGHVVSISVDTDVIWAAMHREDSLVRIDPKTNTVVATIPLFPDAKGPDSLCGWCVGNVAIADGSVWVALGQGNGVARIDPITNQVVAKIDIEGANYVAVSNGVVWVTVSPEAKCDNGTSYLVQIDPNTNTAIGKIALDCPGAIAVGYDSLWVDTSSSSDTDFAVTRIQLNP
jgi:streptogramin lyase